MGVLMKVLVMLEEAGGNKSWVAQALSADMANQGDTMLNALSGLGHCFDTRDVVCIKENIVELLPHAPKQYWNAWEDGYAVGTFVLGKNRAAEVRLGKSPFDKG